MELFRIETIGQNNNNLIVLQGVRANNSRFAIYITRYESLENIIIPNYIFSRGLYYVVNISNEIDNNLDVHNFYWQNINYNNNNFPFYTYGLSETVYLYIKGLIF